MRRLRISIACRADAFGYIDRQALTCPLVDDRQALEVLTRGAAVVEEVVGPDVVGGPKRCRARSTRRSPASRGAPRYLQLRLTVQAEDAVRPHREPPAREENLNAPVAVARVLSSQLGHDWHHRGVTARQPGRVAMRRRIHRHFRTGETTGRPTYPRRTVGTACQAITISEHSNDSRLPP